METISDSIDNIWRTHSFRQNVRAKIEKDVRQYGNPTTESVYEMENRVFQKAKSRDEYLSSVARLIIHVREIRLPGQKGEKGNTGPPGLFGLPGVSGFSGLKDQNKFPGYLDDKGIPGAKGDKEESLLGLPRTPGIPGQKGKMGSGDRHLLGSQGQQNPAAGLFNIGTPHGDNKYTPPSNSNMTFSRSYRPSFPDTTGSQLGYESSLGSGPAQPQNTKGYQSNSMRPFGEYLSAIGTSTMGSGDWHLLGSQGQQNPAAGLFNIGTPHGNNKYTPPSNSSYRPSFSGTTGSQLGYGSSLGSGPAQPQDTMGYRSHSVRPN